MKKMNYKKNMRIKKVLFLLFSLICFFSFSKISFGAVIGSTIGGRDYGSTTSSLNHGLVGYWTFNNQDMLNGAVLDKSGNGNTGNLVSISTSTFYTQGKLGQAFKFDGVNDRVSVTSPSVINNLGPMTISVWINPKVNGNVCAGCGIVTKDNSLSNGRWILSYSTSNVISFAKANTGVVARSSNTNAVLRDKWQHVVVTWDGSNNSTGIRIYIDGREVSSYTNAIEGSGSTSDAGLALNIGSRGAGSQPFTGLIDDVRIYNRILSASEIAQLYEQGQAIIGQTQNPRPNISSLDSGLVGYWTFNNQDMLNGAVRDKSGNGNTGNLVSISTSTFYTQGKLGQAFKFDGVNDHMKILDSASFNSLEGASGATVSFWVKRLSYYTASSHYISRNDGSLGRLFSIRGDSFFPLRPAWRYGGSGTGGSEIDHTCTSSNCSLPLGKWVFVTFVYNDPTSYIYIDGVLKSQNSGTGGVLNTGISSPIFIGSSNTPSNYNYVVMDDVRIYSRALSASEINKLYKQDQVTIGATQNPRPNISSLDSGLVGYWTFNNQDMLNGAVRDKSGNGNTGNLVSISTSTFYTSGKLGQAFKFDGTDDMVRTGSDFIGTNPATISLWFNAQSFGEGNNARLMTNHNVTGFFFRVSTTNSVLQFSSNAGTNNAVSANNAVVLNKWIHAVVTRDASGIANIYVNGVLSGSANQNSGTPQAGSTNVIIGNHNGGVSTFHGSIDDVRVYNRVLSASEIKLLYNSGL